MSPAQQCFRPGNLSSSQIDLRLVVQRELLRFERATQHLLDRLPLHRPNVHGGPKKLETLTPILLRLVHGGIGVLDECFGVDTVVGIDAHPNAGRHVKIMLSKRMGLCNRLQHSARCNRCILGLLNLRKQHDEFIAALPADGVRASHAVHQATRDRLKKFVASGMTQGVIDVFEAIQIEEHEHDFFHMTPR